MNIKSKIKKNIRYLDVIIFSVSVLCFLHYVLDRHRYFDRMYKIGINAVVVKTDDDKRANAYILDDGDYVCLLAPWGDKILIDDSISKAAGTFKYRVYRKNEVGIFVFLGLHNIEDEM